jgi:hypothetical protein
VKRELMVIVSWSVFWFDPRGLKPSHYRNYDNPHHHRVCAGDLTEPAAHPIFDVRRRLLSSCYIFAFLAMVELTAVHIAYRNERRKIDTNIRRTARWLVPVAFVVVNSILIVHFLS